MDSQIVLTLSGLLEFLNSVDELNEYQLSVTETLDDNIAVTIGDSTYIIDCNDVQDIKVEEEVVDEIDSIDEESYEELINESDFEEFQPDIEGGILTEAFKGIALTGLARFVGNKIKD